MTHVRPRGEKVRTFIIENVESHPSDIAKVTATEFELTRQAVNKHLRNLVSEGALIETGSTRNKTFRLCADQVWNKWYHPSGLEEDVVWTNDVNPKLQLPENAMRIWNYCVTEILSNAIDHSDAASISIEIKKSATTTEITIYDSGVGIFKKIMDALGLPDQEYKNHTARTTKKVFDDFSTAEQDGFTKTIVPVRLSLYGDEQLVSRSQAKRLLARVDKFKTVVLDFEGVSTIGHSYADEIFRVFANANPAIQLLSINANDEVQANISQARRAAA